MKTLVMTVIFAVTGMVNAMANNTEKNFAYNDTMAEDGRVASQIVYKVTDGKFLQNHWKYNFAYDAEGRVMQKEALKWSEIEQAFERFYCLNYHYTETGTDVEYALWNEGTGAYSDVKERAVYMQAGDGVNYLGYEWNEKDNDWNLLVEHAATGEDVLLLAVN